MISDVRINNIRYAMIGQLQNPSPGFEDVIKAHFYLKKDRLLQASILIKSDCCSFTTIILFAC